ncbi:ParA family protein [Candidatus Odyssella thessalonicensis]|uniref:ParA family protein n=1 Tax=Candidatus Odyssella thessalonicensis TaxID=84647 RepID=UPI000225B95B|nr:ParA family protein [Candidatus Odyssella thessalonicensis]
MEHFYFNQSMLGHITNAPKASLSRAIANLDVTSIVSDTGHNRKFDIENIRKVTDVIYASHNKPIKQKVQVFYNFKGGTGKTSLCFQVATHLSLLGFKVLCIDLDPQAHLSSVLGITEDQNCLTAYDILINDAKVSDSLIKIFPGLDLIPSNISLTRVEIPLNAKNRREEKLKNVIDSLRLEYDYIILDTNPTISTLNMNALVASDRINIVCETQPFSLAGLRVLVDELEKFYADMGIIPHYCIIPNKYEIKTATAQEVLGALRAEYGNIVQNTIIRKSEEINIASKKKLPIAAFCKAKSASFEDILDLVHEIVRISRLDF